jgi:gamma-glutamyltranspeptidase/glutathione hydrolase
MDSIPCLLRTRALVVPLIILGLIGLGTPALAQGRPNKPVLHGRHWVAITGKPLGAAAGARIFEQGGNAVDAACAMLAATATMWDVLSWGGETQALVYNPKTREVIAVNALGVAPTGATAEHFREQGLEYPPAWGPQAAVTPGTPGGLMTLLAEWGSMSLAEVLAPAIEMADGYAIEAQTANAIERSKERLKQWKYSKRVFLPHLGETEREAPYAGEVFRQPDLAATLRKLVEAEQKALEAGADRKEAIHTAYDRFYKGDIAEEIARSTQEQGGLITTEDLAGWKVHLEEPVHTNYHGYDVYKLTVWTQGPVLLQMLNELEHFDLEAMGYNSARYIHTLYQVMNQTYADRDFYYGDPYRPPEEPVAGLLSKDYAAARVAKIDPKTNDPDVKPGDPYAFQEGDNPYTAYLDMWPKQFESKGADGERVAAFLPGDLSDPPGLEDFYAGTTSVQAADAEGWVVSITPSGGWIPAVIAGTTGVGLSQRMQSFVVEEAQNPYNVVTPGQHPRVTLTPSLVLKDGQPWVSVAVQGGDSQDQNTLQFLLNLFHFGMNVQESVEAANFNSFQMYSSFGEHDKRPGRLLLNDATPPWVRKKLEVMGYDLIFRDRTSGPLNAIWFDREHGTFWGGSSDHGEDYGLAW